MKLSERFIHYTQFDTQSSEDSQTVPSTSKQLVFARFLRDEMISEGLQDVVLDDNGYLYGTLPAQLVNSSTCQLVNSLPTIGFISHYDTSPDCSGKDVKARIVEHYDGGDIELSPGRVSSPEKFPELLRHVGEDLIVTDGTTLLGADDKAGIAEIMQAMCYLRDHPEIEHGTIRVAFNPDEEIGMGAHHFDVERFGCDYAYTIDGGDLGELEYENFNAASAKIHFKGVSVHPGYAKGKMLNAARIATEFANMLPADEIPERTEGREGFFHLTGMTGGCEQAELSYIIRDHDRERFEERKLYINKVAEKICHKYGEGVCHAVVVDQYYNMLEKIDPVRHIIEKVEQAMAAAGVTPKVQPIRGGTDGAQLSFKGLPCPNIFTGAVNFHGPHEFVSLQVMEKAVQTIVNICRTSLP
ncbi:MAG: peptidase T [Prevotella sp.]|nr:peptidase T [Prevotella sp.]MBR1839848.1 peptidase T [Prevotella sp.]